MKRRSRRIHAASFKAKAALAAARRDKSPAGLAKLYDIHPNQITDWNTQLLERVSGVFGEKTKSDAPDVDLKNKHAKIGQLTLENDLLEGALTKAGMVSARR